jgi:hypothetical protein
MPSRRILLAALLAAVAVPAREIPAESGRRRAPSSGIQGMAIVIPTSPVGLDGVVTFRSLPKAEVVVRSLRSDAELARVQANANGVFQIPLPPGIYRIIPLSPNPDAPYPYAVPQTVMVRRGRVTKIMIEYDSGIR